MAIEVSEVEEAPAALIVIPWRPDVRRRRRRAAWALVAVALYVIVLVGIVTSTQEAGRRDAQLRSSVRATAHQVDAVRAGATRLHQELRTVDDQVTLDTTRLTASVTQLQGLQRALARSKADTFVQASAAGDLLGCLSGVERALNALAVGDRGPAVAAFEGVIPLCRRATAEYA